MKILVLPDIHGRRFWKAPCELAERYEKIVFLGDYLDPYAFEGIEVSDAFSNFKEIVAFKKRHSDNLVIDICISKKQLKIVVLAFFCYFCTAII